MWINRAAYREWVQSVKKVEVDRDRALLEGERLRRLVDSLQAELIQKAVVTEQAHAAERVAKAYTDMYRLRVNELTMERTALLNRVTGLDLPVARIENEPVLTGAGTMFDDVGDDMAKHLGIAEHPIDAILGAVLKDPNET